MLTVFWIFDVVFFMRSIKLLEKSKKHVNTSNQLDIICHWIVKRVKYIWIFLLHVEMFMDKIQFEHISLTGLSQNLILNLTNTHNGVIKLCSLLYNSIVTIAQWAVVHNVPLQFVFTFNRLRTSVLFDVDYIIIFRPNHMYEYVFTLDLNFKNKFKLYEYTTRESKMKQCFFIIIINET